MINTIDKLPNTTKYYQGYYKLQNEQKYIGDVTDIVYRSSWESKFMEYCDSNPHVKKWSSRTIKIAYVDNNGHRHTYTPDFYFEIDNTDDAMSPIKYLAEITPDVTTKQPVLPNNINEKNLKNLKHQFAKFAKNKCKWTYAREWCNDNDMKFLIITEKYLNKL